jgi:hypothetical protein
MVAKPASTERSAHAISVKGTTLFNNACTKKRRHTAGSRGIGTRRTLIQSKSADPAISVLAAMSVSGGIVATPILMKV